MAFIRLGNLSASELEAKTGLEFTDAEREELEAARSGQAKLTGPEDCRAIADALAAQPVLDPEKVAGVINRHVLGKANGGTASWAWVDCSCGEQIRVAGVTRDHVYSLGQMHQARALCEAAKRGELS